MGEKNKKNKVKKKRRAGDRGTGLNLTHFNFQTMQVFQLPGGFAYLIP